jgi:Zn-dependent M28 family amino/carboxypeptidase
MAVLAGAALGQAHGAVPAIAPDAAIAAAIGQISAERVEADISILVGFGTRSTISAQSAESIASGRGIGAARNWIKSQLESYSRDCKGCLEVRTDAFLQPPADRIPAATEITNVYAILKGTDPEAAQRVVLVTGHYDSRNSDPVDGVGEAPGANDDASGTVVSLECARVLSKLRFPATIVFLAVAGEEQGLNGSQHFAQLARQNQWDVVAVLNNDIVGGDRSDQQKPHLVRVFSEGIPIAADEAQLRAVGSVGAESDSASRQVARYVADIAQAYTPGLGAALIFRPDRYRRGGDQMSFDKQGYAAVRLTEFRENYNHQHQNVRTENGIEYGDLPKFVDYGYVTGVAKINAATLASLASAPPAPSHVALRTTDLENRSTLTWKPAPGAASYEVLWRNTTSAEWTDAQRTGATTMTLDLSKDNVIFAVRAVDRAGHVSVAAPATAER